MSFWNVILLACKAAHAQQTIVTLYEAQHARYSSWDESFDFGRANRKLIDTWRAWGDRYAEDLCRELRGWTALYS